MVDAPALQRVKSVVPCTCFQIESTVIPAPLSAVWNSMKEWKLETVAPGVVAATEWVDGAAGQVDSSVQITYVNGAKWTLRITELSERNHTLAYELISAEPATDVSQVTGELAFQAVTDDETTFLRWSTEYSNDVDAEFIGDAKWKKRDLFTNIKETIAARAGSQ